MYKVGKLAGGFLAVALSTSLFGCVASSSNNFISSNVEPGDTSRTGSQQLPTVSVADLEGNDFILPRDFAADYNLVVFGFAHKQQESINTWLPHLISYVEGNSDIQLMEIPVIDNSNAALRTIIRNGMRSGITDPAARLRTRTLFVDKSKFESAIGVSDNNKILLVVFNRSGEAIGRESGDFSEAKFEALKKFVRR
jgi:hypothetical protein